ncbi:MAG: oligopeptide transporter, OPT family [Xanthomonadaceae bacterium]|nr:oligopeptide transporter, OPT family [Xanthomonadaceae bacterium]MDE2178986.1 oligopeptide transporter, OPT family [Xanthomonadaceae bacterium]
MNSRAASDTRELTVRGVILGIVITLVFTAANVYFGLKAGLTFATSIPAAVISMALLKGMGGSSMQENNIVQTLASAAGTLSAIIFVLPGLVMVGWWQGFPFWMSFGVCALGGILGVMYSIPLRRALVTGSDLPYPEGVACAEVLKVGSSATAGSSAARENRAGLLAVTASALVSAGFAVVVATRVFAGNVAAYFRFGDRGATGADFSLSFALFAVGHLVGLWVGLSMLLGALIGWAGLVPVFTWLHPATGSASDVAQAMWATRVRFVGAGTIGVAAIWTLARLVQPVVSGLRGAMAAARVRKAGKASTLPRTEQDLPIGLVGLITLVSLLPIAWMLVHFGLAAGLRAQITLLLIGALVFIVLMSFFVSAVCGYMAGLIGSSNSPLSGVGILVVIAAALLLVLGVAGHLPAGMQPALVAYALFVTAVVFAVATIANNNLQDLKTGQLVDATPWKQQVALVIGVIAGAVVIPPVLDLLLKAYGFAGMPGTNPTQALAAPQAALISALAQGVIEHKLDWSMIGLGAAIGVVIVILDELLGRRGKSARLPPLAVGLGIYLPTSTTLMVVVGAVAGWYFDRRAEHTPKPEATRQLGVLLASGMIVGESLIGVALAALVVFSGKDAPLALVGPGFAGAAVLIGALAFALVMIAMYAWLFRLARRAA